MKRALTTLALVIVAALPDISQAMPMQPGPYVTGFIGATMPRRNDDVTTTDFNTNKTYNERTRFDPGVYVGGAGGFDFGFLRLEGELSYKEANIKSITDNTGVYQYRDINGNLGALAFMGNAFFDFHNYTPVTPFVGGGIGFANLHLDNTYATNTTAGNQRQLMYPRDNDTVFAYQAGAGFNIALTRRFSLDLGYRYFNTDWASFSRNSLTTSGIRFESHNAMIGFRTKF